MPESLVAATLNAAAALDLSKDYGTLSRGKYADMVIFDAPRSGKRLCQSKIMIYMSTKPCVYSVNAIVYRALFVYSVTS